MNHDPELIIVGDENAPGCADGVCDFPAEADAT